MKCALLQQARATEAVRWELKYAPREPASAGRTWPPRPTMSVCLCHEDVVAVDFNERTWFFSQRSAVLQDSAPGRRFRSAAARSPSRQLSPNGKVSSVQGHCSFFVSPTRDASTYDYGWPWCAACRCRLVEVATAIVCPNLQPIALA